MNKQTKINVKGSKNLITAFITELSTLGWKPINISSNEAVIEAENLSTVMDTPYKFSEISWGSSYGDRITYKLPTQWSEAVEAFKNYDKIEYKVGDFVYHLPGFDNINNHSSSYLNNYGGAGYKEGAVTQIKSIDKYTTGNILFFKNWENGVVEKAVRPATPEEIEKAQKPQEIIVKCKYQDGEFDVKVKAGTTQMESEDGKFNITDIRKLHTLMINVNTTGDLVSPWNIYFPIADIGCKKGVQVESIKEIIDTWEKLNK